MHSQPFIAMVTQDGEFISCEFLIWEALMKVVYENNIQSIESKEQTRSINELLLE